MNKIIEQTNPFFPVSLRLAGKKCLLAGGGKIAERKLRKLILCGAEVTVISPLPTDYILELASSGRIILFQREYIKKECRSFFMVFVATDNKIVNRKIVKECVKNNILCCAVDKNWVKSSFITPASLINDRFCVSVSTNGLSCGDSKRLKNMIQGFLREKGYVFSKE